MNLSEFSPLQLTRHIFQKVIGAGHSIDLRYSEHVHVQSYKSFKKLTTINKMSVSKTNDKFETNCR